jgi:hypothetical protein
MNINDIEEKVEIPKDKLEAIFARQMELELKYNPIEKQNGAQIPDLPLDINTFDGQRRIKAIIFRIADELFEASNCLRNKDWKTTHVMTDESHFKEEIIDAYHFFHQLFIEIGMDAEQVYRLYDKKNQVNQFRIRSNY